MATNNAVNTSLSGQTGTGTFVGATSPTLVTPTLGAATATSVAFSPTTGGIIGTTAADNAGAGNVGEVISSTILVGSAVSLVSGVAKNMTSISLTAGDWDVYGNITFGIGNLITNCAAWISLSSATGPDDALLNLASFTSGLVNGFSCIAPFFRANVSTTTTVYISGVSTFTGSTSMCGQIYARRRR